MADYRRQHFVPQFYLKRFSRDGKSTMLFNIERQLTVDKVSIKNQCYSDYFYGSDGLEQLLSALEGVAAKMLGDIEKDGHAALLGNEYNVHLRVFVMVLLHRTLAFQMSLNQMICGIREDLSKEVLSTAAQKTLDSMPDAVPAQSVIQAVRLAPYISDLALAVLRSSDLSAFITSDNPVVMINPFLANAKLVGSSTGYYCKGLVIYVPIAPSTAILFYDSEVYSVPVTTGSALTCTDEDVVTLNQLMYTNAHQNLYSMDTTGLFTSNSGCVRRETLVEVVRGTLIKTGSRDEKDNLLRVSKVDVKLNGSLSFLTIREDASQMMQDKLRDGSRVSFFRDDERRRKLEAVLEKQEHLSYKEFMNLFENSRVV